MGPEGDPAAAERFARGLGLAGPETIRVAHQRHTARILPAAGTGERTSAGYTRMGEGDGLVTEAGKFVGIFTADCVPVLLADPASRRVAALHAGWRGVAEGILAAGVAALGGPAGLLAWVGPGARGPCYEVTRDVAARVRAALGEGPPPEGEKGPLDLVGLVASCLARLGLGKIHLDGSCTICDPRFFSHRRDVTRRDAAREGGKTGRMIGVVGWRA